MSSDIEQQCEGLRDKRADYDSRADKLWSVYNKEAESYDRALMETWKDDMDSIIIFAGLFSAVLTAFLVDASKRLKADPADQTNALLSQTVVLLAQISQQLGPNGSQTIISLPQPLEPFILNSSDLHVNIFWFMSLAFSITAALGATLVQQWVRDYLQVFQRFSGSLERSRMRQFLFHGLAENYMPLLVECIPAFIHISLFLFFIGLAESLFVINSAVAITTTAIIGFCALFYITCSVFPVFYTKTPYHTPLSTIFWKLAQIIRPRKYSDKTCTEGRVVPVNSDMSKGRFQLAMGHCNDRMTRDTGAIRWALTKITGDSEFEPFLASIGGSLATPWGRDVWRCILRASPGDTAPTWPSTTITSNTMQALKIRIESLLLSCGTGVSTLSDQPSRFARACICIDATASLMLGFPGSELDIDNDLMNNVLKYFGEEKKRQDKLAQEAKTSSTSGSAINLQPNPCVTDISLEIKWKCLVLIGMRKSLRDSSWMPHAVEIYRRCVSSKEYKIVEGETMTKLAREVDYELLKAWNAARQLYSELREIPEEQLTEDRLNLLIPHWRDHIEAMQESLDALNLQLHPTIDSAALNFIDYLICATGDTLENLGGIFSEWPSTVNPAITRTLFEGLDLGARPPNFLRFMPHLIPPRLLIGHLLVCADPRRQLHFNSSASRIDLAGLSRLLHNPEMRRFFTTPRADTESGLIPRSPQPYVNQFWRVEDIGEHEGVGFMIEMFFATFRSLEDEYVTLESRQLLRATLLEISDNGQSEYFRTACRQFLWSLRQEIDVLWNLRIDEQIAKGTRSTFIINTLQQLLLSYATCEEGNIETEADSEEEELEVNSKEKKADSQEEKPIVGILSLQRANAFRSQRSALECS